MSNESGRRRLLCILAAFAVCMVIAVVVGVFYDHYYEFNDDVLMKDILSGAYTGRPSALNIQMQSPLSAIIALMYRVIPGIPWYGLFLCGCQYLCFFLILHRSFCATNRFGSRAAITVIVLLFAFGVMLPHLIMVQYTVTVAVLAATASFCFYMIPVDTNRHEFRRQTVIPVILIIIAFQLRSEMLLLMLPCVVLTIIARWSREAKMLDRETMKRYLQVAAAVAAGIILSAGVNRISYSSDEWTRFLSEFDSRTRLYDYEYVPTYRGNEDFYRSIDISPSQVRLLERYDYGIDEKIDGSVMEEIAGYAHDLRGESAVHRAGAALYEYVYGILHFKGGAYSAFIWFMYVMLCAAILARKESTPKHKAAILCIRVLGLFAARSVSWIYIIWGRRQPDRITHSLYIIESVILSTMLLTEFTSKLRNGKYMQMIAEVILIVGGLMLLPPSIEAVNAAVARQEEINLTGRAIDSYCKAHPDSFYFEDVYSTIIDGETFNEKMFSDIDDSFKNYDLIGGWIMNSPLFRLKLSSNSMGSVSDSLLYSDNVYIICSGAGNTGWIGEHYLARGIKTKLEPVDTIIGDYVVYRVMAAD